MQLCRLSIRNFKKYQRAEIIFKDGLTGIVGGNGVGKSTIVEAIAWALYGSKASTIKRDLIRNTSAGENDLVQVTLTLGLRKHELSVSRGMRGKNLSPEATLSIDGRRVAYGSKEVDQRLEEMLKISFSDFMKTFYARQKDLDNLLREGGTGKKEYLLKLLGLNDIREFASEQIKTDIRAVDDQKSKISGALAEIGDVEKKITDTIRSISIAKSELVQSRSIESKLSENLDRIRKEIDLQNELRRSHDILAEQISRSESLILDKRKDIAEKETRLKKIEESKILLAKLEPKLNRLKEIKARTEFLEPKRKEHDKHKQTFIRIVTELSGIKQNAVNEEQRIKSLNECKSKLSEIKHLESEYQDAQTSIIKQEPLRELYIDLWNKIKEHKIRLELAATNSFRAENEIQQLLEAVAKIESLQPIQKEHIKLRSELEDLIRHREIKKELDGLISRKTAVEARSLRLTKERSLANQDLAAIGDLKTKDAELRNQDSDLDKLRTDLDNARESLKGDLKVQDSILNDAKRNLLRLKDLGAEISCPTCERPLGDQYQHLLKKYESSIRSAELNIGELKKAIKKQNDNIDGVISSRSNLKKAFDELNHKKNQQTEIMATLMSLDRQENEISIELEEIDKAIASLGEIRYDQERFVQIQSRVEKIQPYIEEYKSLVFKLEQLPKVEADLAFFKKEKQDLDQRIVDFNRKLDGLGFVESDYQYVKKRISELKQYHDDFVILSQKVLEIPNIEDRIKILSATQKKLEENAADIQNSLQSLDFNPLEYEDLIKESKGLSHVEEESYKIELEIAAETEIQRGHNDALLALADLQSRLIMEKKQLFELNYDKDGHNAVHQELLQVEDQRNAARKDALEKQVKLGILESEINKLSIDASRKKEHEQELGSLCRKMEIIDTAKSLLNRFMDHILVRMRSDIVQIAGEILEEISGKYSMIKIDDDFNILVEDGGVYYPITRYSGGEVDMIALSVRVAISEYLMSFSKNSPSYSFLILDEVFGSQDLEHREKMINMLRSLQERFPQIIAISHFSDVQGQFDNTIQVVEDDMGNSKVEVF
jgi:exonuclease SbcC